ncbi:MAG: 4-alpha-glucanotransferase [Gemmatimonadota bacterium]|nr:4-alpha-glucanotransferase [Gemmatimonadota bacterium]
MKLPRSAGILLHPTSLPGPAGIGDFGPDAYRFLDFLKAAGFKIWQMLPLGPTGYGDSPYQCFSAFAGNPLLIHVPGATNSLSTSEIDFAALLALKRVQMQELHARFVSDSRFEKWVKQQGWLDDFALFTAIKADHGGAAWPAWRPELARRDNRALEEFRASHLQQIQLVYFEQYVFFRQFEALKAECVKRGIRLMGDVPIYVAHDSADVWANRELFQLDDTGALTVQAGVPPDYFSETGQLWGNPIYNWEAMREGKFAWWINRMRASLAMFDIVRLDHFRGFEAYWEVAGSATTAINGQWVKGPGAALFDAMTAALGPLPVVAENLGLITPEVETLREQFAFPGMSILQFAFGGDDTKPNEFKPHNLRRESVLYTGTHDNDTTVGWWNAGADANSTRAAADIEREKADARAYLNTDGTEMHWTLIRAALGSVADTVLIPMQDILGLGSDARMNLPGRQSGNWKFRFAWTQLEVSAVTRLHALNKIFDR